MKNMVSIVSVLIASNLVAAERIDYESQVKPLLAQKCFACHGALKQESGLRLDAASLLHKGGDSGTLFEAGDSETSLLIQRVSAPEVDERMPPEGEGSPLNESQLAMLRAWIDQGAIAPDEAVPANPRQHWAYQPPIKPTIPTLQNPRWGRNAIDQFIGAHHDARGLTPAHEARPEILLRRVYLDLVGLSPTRAQLRDYLEDASPHKYERLVERLLSAPQYGERWARHWMDVWRYSDHTGFDLDGTVLGSQRHIWRWRDWIVGALNEDQGYDRMILEMLAADELSAGDEHTLVASGFLVRNYYKHDRNRWLDDVIDHTSRAFMSVTMGCAKCHDHKYDPISMHEYYRMRAIFEPYNVRVDRISGELDVNRNGLTRIYDADLAAPTWLFVRGNPKAADMSIRLGPAVPAVFGGALDIKSSAVGLASYYPALRSFVTNALLEKARRAVEGARANLDSERKKQEERKLTVDERSLEYKMSRESVELAELKLKAATTQQTALQARLAAERAKYEAGKVDEQLIKKAVDAERRARLADGHEKLLESIVQLGTLRLKVSRKTRDYTEQDSKQALRAAEKRLDAAKKEFTAALEMPLSGAPEYEPLGTIYPRQTSGRRLAFARWIVDRQNPLTARVAVNHIWLRHFGRALVDSVDDFGLRCERPPMAELLDFLATELLDNQFSMKHIHRLIVTSTVYRMASHATPHTSESKRLDVDNDFYWRGNVRRCEAETVRDTLLYLAGDLDLQAGGPDIDSQQGQEIPRRSLYFRHAENKQMSLLELFDAANPNECYRREESIRPQQALALVNSALAMKQSRRLARRLSKTASDRHGFIEAAFETILCRAPSSVERTACQDFLTAQLEQVSQVDGLTLVGDDVEAIPPSTDPAIRARENMVLVLINHNDFVTIR